VKSGAAQAVPPSWKILARLFIERRNITSRLEQREISAGPEEAAQAAYFQIVHRL
jgi:hypothetical protein